MSDSGRRFRSEDEEAQHFLQVLRDGSREEKIEARERLSQIFEGRDMIEEACELLEGNARAGIRSRALFTRLASFYRRLGRDDDADAAMAEAGKYLENPRLPVQRPIESEVLVATSRQEAMPPMPVGACSSCGYMNGPSRATCKGCRQPLVRVPVPHQHAPMQSDSGDSTLVEVQEILTPHEQVLGYAVQSRIALSVKRDAVVATSNRLILYRPSILGARNFADYLWQDVKDVRIHDGMLSSEIRITRADGRGDSLGSLDKGQARRVYVICQQKEQEWREKRRIRQMEEDRARAGGVHITAGQQSGGVEDPMEKLARAKAMLDQGLISEAEYETIKARVLSSF
ncbi:MAG: PH domain-containing protein [Chloroflexota bacterium]